MREINFRAWNKKYKEMLTHIEICFLNPLSKIDGTEQYAIIYDNKLKNKIIQEFGDIEQLILMQYTGIKDKNGVYIYEDDIISFKNPGCNTIRMIVHSVGHMYDFFNDIPSRSLKAYQHQLEVLGNIHQNPEITGESK